jgi:hypothetical protein
LKVRKSTDDEPFGGKEKGSQRMPITKSQARALRMKYAPGLTRFDIKFSEVAGDIAPLFLELPNADLIAKYNPQRQDHGMRFFIASDDVNWLLDRITPVDDPKPAEEKVDVEIEQPKETELPEPPSDPPIETGDKPPTDTEGQSV